MHACGNWLHDLPLYFAGALAWGATFGRGAVAWVRAWLRRKEKIDGVSE